MAKARCELTMAALPVRMRVEPVQVEFSPEDRAEILARIDEKLRTGHLSQAECVEEFEHAFASYTGARYAVAVSSGSAALEVALAVLAPADRTVLVPANSFFAAAAAVLRLNAKLRLADIDPATLAPGLANLEAAWTPDTTGLILVHMGGIISPEIHRIRDWCDGHGMWLLEDCAHAHGSRLGALHAGRFGIAGAFSFFATKVITSGEGGMLITQDGELAREARLHRNLGKPDSWVSHHVCVATNVRMTEIAALIGSMQLRRLDEFLARRNRVAARYTEALANCRALRPILPAGRSSWYKYPVMLRDEIDRPALKRALLERGVQLAGEIYDLPLHRQPALSPGFPAESFPAAEAVCAHHICLPIHCGMGAQETDWVIENLTSLLEPDHAAQPNT